MQLNNSLRQQRVQLIVDAINVSAPGRISIYDGTPPSRVAVPFGKNSLADLILHNPAQVTISNGVAALADPAPVIISNSGNAGWALLRDGTGAALAILTVTTASGNGEVKLSSLALVAGKQLSASNLQITEP